jgi:hypothetical protein
MQWLKDRAEDIAFWWSTNPIKKLWRGMKDRFDAAIFCLLLLAVGIYSPRALRAIMVDSLKDSK